MLHRRQFLQMSSGAIAFRPKNLSCIQNRIQGCTQAPKFWFGDYICQERICDDDLDPDSFGKPFRSYGVIIGLFFSTGNRHHFQGWNYFVSWRWVNGEAVDNPNWDDAAHESDLKLSNFLIPPTCH